MSDDEDAIWGYRSIRKCKASDRRVEEAGCQERARELGVTAKRGGNRKRNPSRKTKPLLSPLSPASAPVEDQSPQEAAPSTPKPAETVRTLSPGTPKNTSSGHCPSCQMPFSILLVQSPRWHVSECLDAPPTAQTDCPDGVRCSSTLPSHYKRYSHLLLAQSRAMDWTSPHRTPHLTAPKAATANGFSPAISPATKGPKLRSPKSRSPSSSSSSQESVQRTPLEVWLSSPTKASQNSSSQEAFSDVPAGKCQPSPQQDADPCDSNISYSPLVSDQELFSNDEGDAVVLGRSSPSSAKVIETPTQCNNDQILGGTCTPPDRAEVMATDYWAVSSTPVLDISEWPPGQLQGVAEHTSGNRHHVPPIKSEDATGNSQPCALAPHLKLPIKTPQIQKLPMMPSAKALKQMDIGVFFGLKPKVEHAQAKVPLKTPSPNAAASLSEKPPTKRKAAGSFSDAGGVMENISGIMVPAATGSQKRGGKRFRQNANTEEWGRGRRQCPFYKKIPGTGFAVDAFQYGEIEGCSAYFLTHFHSDHYVGLTKKFRFPIYCSKITGNLVQSKLRVEKEFVNCLPMYTECTVNGVRVVLLDANHCPGAVLLLFILPNGTAILHTGDFRADTSMERYPALLCQKIHTLYLDTTYCSPEYTFPSQSEAVQFAVNAAFEMVTLHPRTLVVCGTYSVGKEKVFLAIADVLGCKVCMSQDKYKTMQCLESEEISARVTTDWHSTALHVLPMMQVHFKGLYTHLNKFSGKYDRVLAFKPTGWTYSEGCSSVAEIRPEIRGKVTLYGIPYSEHSSYSEMKRFVQFLKPQKIIPTVNVGSGKSRAAMEKHFTAWLSETWR